MTTEKSATPAPTEGWMWLINSPKWHYFRNNESLCRRYFTFVMSDLQQGNDNSPDNCKACMKKLQKERDAKATHSRS